MAALARRVEAHFGGVPQDVEWAIEHGRLHLLQARPMTALPDVVDWAPPAPGYWLRTFRLGEWLSDPMTPLFREWLLVLLEEGFLHGMRQTTGTAVAFPSAAINGWSYTIAGPRPSSIPGRLLRAIVESRGRALPVLFNALMGVNTRPDLADRALLHSLAEHWRRELLPHYQQLYLVNTANTRIFNVAVSGARSKLVGGDSGRYEHETFGARVHVADAAARRAGCHAGPTVRLSHAPRGHGRGADGVPEVWDETGAVRLGRNFSIGAAQLNTWRCRCRRRSRVGGPDAGYQPCVRPQQHDLEADRPGDRCRKRGHLLGLRCWRPGKDPIGQ
jgi:hypothetical protein